MIFNGNLLNRENLHKNHLFNYDESCCKIMCRKIPPLKKRRPEAVAPYRTFGNFPTYIFPVGTVTFKSLSMAVWPYCLNAPLTTTADDGRGAAAVWVPLGAWISFGAWSMPDEVMSCVAFRRYSVFKFFFFSPDIVFSQKPRGRIWDEPKTRFNSENRDAGSLSRW